MCSTALEFRYCDDPDRWWVSTSLPEEMKEWLWENVSSVSLGGTTRSLSSAQILSAYRKAFSIRDELLERYPEYADNLVVLRLWHCHGEELEQAYPTRESILQEMTNLEEGKGLSRYYTAPPIGIPGSGRVIRGKGAIVEKKDRPPLTFPDSYYKKEEENV
jgi:hypothetical protein